MVIVGKTGRLLTALGIILALGLGLGAQGGATPAGSTRPDWRHAGAHGPARPHGAPAQDRGRGLRRGIESWPGNKVLAQWLKKNRVDTVLGKLRFDGPNNYGDDLIKIKQVQDGRWVVVWPKEFAAPGARLQSP
jgi:hypothetical protein